MIRVLARNLGPSIPFTVTFMLYAAVRLAEDVVWCTEKIRGFSARTIESASTNIPLVMAWIHDKSSSSLEATRAFVCTFASGLWDALRESAIAGCNFFWSIFGDWYDSVFTIVVAILPYLLCIILLDMIMDRMEPYAPPRKPSRWYRGFTRSFNPLFIFFGPLSESDSYLAIDSGFEQGVCQQTKQASQANTADTFVNKDGEKCVWIPFGTSRIALPVADVLEHFQNASQGAAGLRGIQKESAAVGSTPYVELSKAPSWCGFISRAHGGDPAQGTDQLSGVTRVQAGLGLSLHSMEAFQRHIEGGGKLYYRRASMNINEPWLDIDLLAKDMPGLIPLASHDAFKPDDPRRRNYLCAGLDKRFDSYFVPVSGADHCTLFPACTGFEEEGNKLIPQMDSNLNEQCFSRLGLSAKKYVSNAKKGKCRVWSLMPKLNSDEVALHKADGIFDCATPTPFDQDLNVAMQGVKRKSRKPIYTGLGVHSASTGSPTSRFDGAGSSSSALTVINNNGTDGDILGWHIASIGKGSPDYQRFASRNNCTNFMVSCYAYYRALEELTGLKFTRRVQPKSISKLFESAPGLFTNWVKTETPTIDDYNFSDAEYDYDDIDIRGVYLYDRLVARYDDAGHDFSVLADRDRHDAQVEAEREALHQEVTVYGGGEADAADHRRINRMRGLGQRMHNANRKGGNKRPKYASPSTPLTREELLELQAHYKDVLDNNRLLVNNVHTFEQVTNDLLLLTELLNQSDSSSDDETSTDARSSCSMQSCPESVDGLPEPLPISKLMSQTNSLVKWDDPQHVNPLTGVRTESLQPDCWVVKLEDNHSATPLSIIGQQTQQEKEKLLAQLRQQQSENKRQMLEFEALQRRVAAELEAAESQLKLHRQAAEEREKQDFQEAGSNVADPNASPTETKKKRPRRKKKAVPTIQETPQAPPGLE